MIWGAHPYLWKHPYDPIWCYSMAIYMLGTSIWGVQLDAVNKMASIRGFNETIVGTPPRVHKHDNGKKKTTMNIRCMLMFQCHVSFQGGVTLRLAHQYKWKVIELLAYLPCDKSMTILWFSNHFPHETPQGFRWVVSKRDGSLLQVRFQTRILRHSQVAQPMAVGLSYVHPLLNDFAHMGPWEDGPPDFPFHPYKESWIQGSESAHLSGVSSGLGWDLRPLHFPTNQPRINWTYVGERHPWHCWGWLNKKQQHINIHTPNVMHVNVHVTLPETNIAHENPHLPL